jgi:ABC-type multidrug transport system ATPase subunit
MDKGKVVKVGTPDELLAKMARKKNAGGGEEAEDEEEEEEEEGADKAWFREMWDMLIEDRQLERIRSH